ncbi:MAG: PilZ domain-containing protein [Planctomycetota bacterium]
MNDNRRREIRIRSVNLTNYSRLRQPDHPEEPEAYEVLGLAQTKDLSASGCRLLTREPLPVGVGLRLDLQLGPTIVTCEGEVVRAAKEGGLWSLGVEFHELEEVAQDGIRAYLQFKEGAEEA